MKLCVLGGSSVHVPALFNALEKIRQPIFDEVVLYGRNELHLDAIGTYCAATFRRDGQQFTIRRTTDLEAATDGASVILNQMRVGGLSASSAERRWLACSGIVAHAASYAEALRNVPALRRTLPTIERRAPHALFINFSNPVSALSETVASETSLKIAGLCYHTTLAREDFARFVGRTPFEIHIQSFGINHVSFVIDVAVDGESRFVDVVQRIKAEKNKEYNFSKIDEAGAIPISHTFSLFSPKELGYVRQYGIRGSLQDALQKFAGIDTSGLRNVRQRQAEMMSRMRSNDPSVREDATRFAPWYAKTIVPFIADYFANEVHEQTVTVRTSSPDDLFGARTQEKSCIVGCCSIQPVAASPVPENLRALLKPVVQSELMLLDAMRRNSLPSAIEALAIHPNVYSEDHAERFLRNFFPVN